MKTEMKQCIVFSICLFGASSLFAQSKQDSLLYDKNWKGVETESSASDFYQYSDNPLTKKMAMTILAWYDCHISAEKVEYNQ